MDIPLFRLALAQLINPTILFYFLDMLLESKESKVYDLAQESIVLVLEFNPDDSMILDWVVDRCFTGDAQVADGCFLALATIFSARYNFFFFFFESILFSE